MYWRLQLNYKSQKWSIDTYVIWADRSWHEPMQISKKYLKKDLKKTHKTQKQKVG